MLWEGKVIMPRLIDADLPIIAYRGETVNDNLDWLRQPAETEGTE
jgi:hypothetical protein